MFPCREGYQYRVASRIRNKIKRIDGDVSILEENRADLLEELRAVVCDGERQPMELIKNTVYQHTDHGEVLVIAVHHVFEEYDMESEGGQPQSRVVRYTTRWDEYGPMPASVQTTPVAEFRTAVDDPIRTVEFTDPGDAVRESG